MVLYDIKKGWFKNIEGSGLEDMMNEVFGNVSADGNVLRSSYGVLERIEAEIVDKSSLRVDTVSRDAAHADGDILNTKRKLNVFVEKATGFDAKARMKRAQQKAKKGEL